MMSWSSNVGRICACSNFNQIKICIILYVLVIYCSINLVLYLKGIESRFLD